MGRKLTIEIELGGMTARELVAALTYTLHGFTPDEPFPSRLGSRQEKQSGPVLAISGASWQRKVGTWKVTDEDEHNEDCTNEECTEGCPTQAERDAEYRSGHEWHGGGKR